MNVFHFMTVYTENLYSKDLRGIFCLRSLHIGSETV